MHLIDSHAHLDFSEFDDDRLETINRAKSSGIEKIINVGTDLESSQKSVKIANNNSNIWATVGVHPEGFSTDLELVKKEVKRMAAEPRVVAIGECGLDYSYDDIDKQHQTDLFRLQVGLAAELNLPGVFHIRNGDDEWASKNAYEILKKVSLQGVVHCFSFGPDWAKKFLDLGFMLGFTGIVTYKNAIKVQESVRYTPLERLIIETDCPFLSPQNHRGKRNEPAYVLEVAEKIAELKNLAFKKVARETTENTQKLFSI